MLLNENDLVLLETRRFQAHEVSSVFQLSRLELESALERNGGLAAPHQMIASNEKESSDEKQ